MYLVYHFYINNCSLNTIVFIMLCYAVHTVSPHTMTVCHTHTPVPGPLGTSAVATKTVCHTHPPNLGPVGTPVVAAKWPRLYTPMRHDRDTCNPDVWTHVLHPPFALHSPLGRIHIQYVPRPNELNIFWGHPHNIPFMLNPSYIDNHVILFLEPVSIDLLPTG